MLRILALIFVTLAGNVLFLRGGGWAEQWALSPTASGLMAGLFSLMMLAVVLQLLASLMSLDVIQWESEVGEAVRTKYSELIVPR